MAKRKPWAPKEQKITLNKKISALVAMPNQAHILCAKTRVVLEPGSTFIVTGPFSKVIGLGGVQQRTFRITHGSKILYLLESEMLMSLEG